MKSTTVLTQKKRRGPAPTGKGELIGVRLHDDLLAPLDAYRLQLPDAPNRQDAIRRILAEKLGVDTP